VTLTETDLLKTCQQRVATHPDAEEERALRLWWNGQRQRSSPLAAALIEQGEDGWTSTILEHRAHRHPWYDYLAHEASVQEFAAFILENSPLPAFLPLVERTLAAQICDQGRAAVLRNIEDEQAPVPHADLMRRLVVALKARAGDGLELGSFPTLADRILVFYYGYYCDPWHLAGSLYATEVMAHYRMVQMGAGLERLQFDPQDLEFIRVHVVCDEGHASDWSEGVIAPSVRLNPGLRTPIAEGIAACLDTSARYLDDCEARAASRPARR
jgi:hypothetical protein